MAFLTAEKIRRPGRRTAWHCVFLPALVLLLSGLPAGKSRAAAFKPAQVKAAFIYNLASFVTWPDDTDPAAGPFVIAVLGDDEIAKNLEILTEGERIQGRPVAIRPLRSPADIGACRILFVGAAVAGNTPQILQSLGGRNVLTVGDSEAFGRGRGMVNLVQRGRRIHLQINIRAARAAGLHFNSKLLKIARIIRSEP